MTFTRTEKLFIFFAMLSAFMICGEYAITRPTSNALFLTLFSVKGYPLVWLATIPLNLTVIYLYNRFLPTLGPLKVLTTLAITTVGVNTLSAALYTKVPGFLFFQYAWKDIYVLLMLKQLWSMIHGTLPAPRAKYLYGCIYGVGTLGAVSGSLIPGFLASMLGSESLLFLTLPIYFLLILSYRQAFNRSGVKSASFEETLSSDPRPREALSLIRRTPVLIGVLLLVIFMQVSVGLTEYQFNARLETHILEKDLRTAFCGQIGGIVNVLSLAFQFLGGFLMIRFLGLRGSHFLIPVILGSMALISFAFPSFAMISASYILIKAVDFSLFGVVREMLYVPLQLDAKFRAKAIIDVFAYRTSKALISLALLALQLIGGALLLPMTSALSIILFIGWFTTVFLLFKRTESLTTQS